MFKKIMEGRPYFSMEEISEAVLGKVVE